MVNERYPEETVISKHDFDKDHCKQMLNSESQHTYHSLHDIFSKVAQKASKDNDFKKAKIYWLLAYATSMILSSKSKSEPFKPLIVTHNCRSAIPDDFSEEDIVFFSEIIAEIDDNPLKARLADLIWLKSKKRNLDYALMAIDSYCKIAKDENISVNNATDFWCRALSLANMVRDGTGNRIQEIEKDIFQSINLANTNDDYRALRLSDLLKNFGLCKSKSEDIAIKLKTLAQQFENEGNLYIASEYFSAASKWFGLMPDKKKSAEMLVSCAENYVKRAHIEQSNMVAAGLYEKAIQILRSIPKVERSDFKLDERILELHKLMNEAGKQSLNEMSMIVSDEMDITQFINEARIAVTGKTVFEALKALANLSPFMNSSKLKQTAIEQINQYPLQSLMVGTYISSDGRTIAKKRGFDFSEALTEEHPEVHAAVMRDHGTYLHLRVKGYILPALEVLHLEQQIHEIDFLKIIQQSSLVPPGREQFFSKGLFTGYDYDFASALHLIAPQIENMVRYHLKNAGAKTTTLDKSGIENENGLSTLIALPEMKSVFGDDVTFELNALFCDPLGANLRNEIAHGLIDYNSCYTIHGVYMWYFTLKLIFSTFWNAARQV